MNQSLALIRIALRCAVLGIICLAFQTSLFAENSSEKDRQKNVILICIGTDSVISTGCLNTQSKFERAGWEVTRIDIKDKSFYLNKLAAAIEAKTFSPTVPVFIHGHGYYSGRHEFGLSDHFAAKRIPGNYVLGIVRFYLRSNPIWISSCHSGSDRYRKDKCTGTCCGSYETAHLNYEDVVLRGTEETEITLATLTDLLTDKHLFDSSDQDHNGILSANEIKAALRKRMGPFKIEPLQIYTTVPKQYGRARFPSGVKVLPLESASKEKLKSLLKKMEENYPQDKIGLSNKLVFTVKCENATVPVSTITKNNFDTEDEADNWARENIPNWPNSGSVGHFRRFASMFSKNKPNAQCKLVLLGNDYIFGIKTPDAMLDPCQETPTVHRHNSERVLRKRYQRPEVNSYHLHAPW